MKANLKSFNGRMTFEVQAETAKDLFWGLAKIQEIFDAESICGLCQSPNIALSAREVDDNKYYSLRCRECYAEFRFGQKKAGADLFPKRKDDDGHYLPNGGWSKYEPKQQQQSAPASGQPSRQQQAPPPSRGGQGGW